jgi:CsoR family transcriptional regulator, copper-sensing transcriptional repressor
VLRRPERLLRIRTHASNFCEELDVTKGKPKSKSARRNAESPADAAACVCGVNKDPAQTRDGVGPGAHAVGVDASIKAANLKHLKRIEGQVRGIAAMIEEDRYCADIIQQAAAVQESLRSVAKNLLKNHLRHCAADALHEPGKKREDMIEEVLSLVGRIAR